MADVTPDYRVEQAKLQSEIAQLEARRLAHRVQLLELVSRRDVILQNHAAELVALATKRVNLAAMEEAHEKLTEADVEDAKTAELDPELPAK